MNRNVIQAHVSPCRRDERLKPARLVTMMDPRVRGVALIYRKAQRPRGGNVHGWAEWWE